MSARTDRCRLSLTSTAMSVCSLLLRAFVLCTLLALSSAANAQFDAPPAPLPPPAPAKKQKTSSLDELQAKIDAFQESITELHKTDPKKAERMIADFARSISSIQAMAEPKLPKTLPLTKTSKFSKHTPAFAIAKHEIERIRTLGDEQHAAEFAKRLSDLETAQAGGDYELPKTKQPEVHYVKLNSGSTLPDEFRTKANRFSKSYAEVHVQRTGAPVILILESRVPTLWNLKLADDVDVFAVIVESLVSQKVIGVENPLLLDTQTAMEKQLFDFQTSTSKSRGELLAGNRTSTKYETQRYEEPIVLGPADKDWRAAFVSDQTDLLVTECRQRRRLLSAKALGELRYDASFSARIDPNSQQFCRGEFNVVGPAASSLVPHSGRTNRIELEVPDGEEMLTFGLTTSGTLVTTKQQSEKPLGASTTPVPFDPKVFVNRSRIRAIAYDSKRHRLLCATTESNGRIAALDIESGAWSQVGLANRLLVGMTYAAETDEIWAVSVNYASSSSGNARKSSAQFLRFAADGKITSEKDISQPLIDEGPSGHPGGYLSTIANHSFQLIVAGEYAVLSGARQLPSTNGYGQKPEDFHYVIEAESGDLVYDGPVFIRDEDDVARRNHNVDGFSALSDLTSLLATLDEQVDSTDLSEEQRLSVGEEVASVRALIAGDDDAFKGKEKSRVYFVGGFASGELKVKVTDTSCPLTLVLSNTLNVRWNVNIAPGVVVEKIIAEGRVKPTVNTTDARVKVEYLSASRSLQLHGENRHLHPGRLKDYVAQKLGLDVSVVTILSRQNRQPVIQLGPQDGPTRLQLAQSKLEEISSELNVEQTKQLADSLQSQSFFALHRGKLPGSVEQPQIRIARAATQVYWNEFSVRGPKIGRSTLAYQTSAFGALNHDGTKLFSADVHRLYIKDLQTGNNETINLRGAMGNIGRISGLYFDAEKKNLLIDTSSAIWRFDEATKKPKLLHSKQAQRSNTSVYSPTHECWFTLEQERRSNREVTRVRRYNQHFAVIDQVVLSQSLTRGSRSFSSSYPPQLVVVGDHLAVIDYLQKREPVRLNGRSTTKSRYEGTITVFEPKSGEVVYEGKLEPCVEFRELSIAQLEGLWQKLSMASEQDAEALMWQMASGGESACEFLKDKYPKIARDTNVDIDALVKQLDDNRFSERDRAYRKLRDAGSVIEPDLRAMIAGDVTPEVRERLESLIAQWNIGTPQNAEQLQKVRGVEVLHRIGNGDTQQLLESLATDEQESYVRMQVERSRRGESVITDGFQNPAVQLQRQLFVPR